jgi:hypothetical protein
MLWRDEVLICGPVVNCELRIIPTFSSISIFICNFHVFSVRWNFHGVKHIVNYTLRNSNSELIDMWLLFLELFIQSFYWMSLNVFSLLNVHKYYSQKEWIQIKQTNYPSSYRHSHYEGIGNEIAVITIICTLILHMSHLCLCRISLTFRFETVKHS